jgi:hypothetical protein
MALDDEIPSSSGRLVTAPPSADDLAMVQWAIQAFEDAWGCISPDGEFRPSIGDPNILWLMMNLHPATAEAVWRQADKSTDGPSGFVEMCRAPDRTLLVTFYKIRTSLFGRAWFGVVSIMFNRVEVKLGCIAAREQEAMWRQFGGFLLSKAKLFDSVQAALAAL